MAVSVVEEATGTLTTDGTEQTLFTEEDMGVFFVRLDLNDIQAGATPEKIEVYEYISAQAASTQRLMEGSPMTYVGGVCPKIVELPHRSIPANCSYAVKIKSTGAVHPDIVWAEIEVG